MPTPTRARGNFPGARSARDFANVPRAAGVAEGLTAFVTCMPTKLSNWILGYRQFLPLFCHEFCIRAARSYLGHTWFWPVRHRHPAPATRQGTPLILFTNAPPSARTTIYRRRVCKVRATLSTCSRRTCSGTGPQRVNQQYFC